MHGNRIKRDVHENALTVGFLATIPEFRNFVNLFFSQSDNSG